MTGFFNTSLSQQQFLQEYWQKKPLLIRQAFPGFQSPISPEELAGLACEPEIESRLIEQYGENDSAWQVTAGPLSESDFDRLPETHWTMLVQDVDKHLPELQTLLDPLRFIPDWRRDDLMISYATESGSVGPHTDAYDVFLLQAMGTRRWQLGDQPIHEAKLIDGLELQILAEFTPDQSWDLEPGDMLYLPPHFAHHGVALDECMTFSFGFRAPASVDMLDAVVNTLLEQELGKHRYQDPDLLLTPHGAEIDSLALARLKQMLHQAIDEAEPVLATVLGKFVSETKPSLSALAAEARAELPSIDELNAYFERGQLLQRNLYCRFAWSANEMGGQLFMAGESYAVGMAGVGNLPLLTEQSTLTVIDWQGIVQDETSANLLCQLIAEGGWFWQNDMDSTG
ncbi:50S ribosomal protein L16 3-hydroxylase [Bathymodiolus platifrons methanotrophic gill symbiont]|uniref:cupin domain-containing protein n=1 Tax=Bathymodiolus platifrons methanotrophic gill symbiont TaxID=113268 RepID=UPI000B409D5C|nr:cupin domain-containing protein [Bathymodiolus platifrons methanotrophic gill symbiont]TXK97461.1 cupin [Methylococcaceae bacterium CS4]TXL06630.1 cupin [Methylococcaceae bacterium CS1]TXL09565.1 cupin [Methylococcaceae bacterium CS3]TXL12116.1 cupin [Methylococcaceae bacterium CS2]GAW85128.1 50S ribosomal protein L16 3-hydroxylase [Bathymodiolus platifrons methanotrophic gill symbiont]